MPANDSIPYRDLSVGGANEYQFSAIYRDLDIATLD